MSSFSETVALGLMKNEAIEFVKYPFSLKNEEELLHYMLFLLDLLPELTA